MWKRCLALLPGRHACAPDMRAGVLAQTKLPPRLALCNADIRPRKLCWWTNRTAVSRYQKLHLTLWIVCTWMYACTDRFGTQERCKAGSIVVGERGGRQMVCTAPAANATIAYKHQFGNDRRCFCNRQMPTNKIRR